MLATLWGLGLGSGVLSQGGGMLLVSSKRIGHLISSVEIQAPKPCLGQRRGPEIPARGTECQFHGLCGVLASHTVYKKMSRATGAARINARQDTEFRSVSFTGLSGLFVSYGAER